MSDQSLAQQPLGRWPGISRPNFTQFPNPYLDVAMAGLSGADFKVLAYITRRTFGFKRESDRISVAAICAGITTDGGRHLERGTGLGKSTVVGAINVLVARNFIREEANYGLQGARLPNTYSIVFVDTEREKDRTDDDATRWTGELCRPNYTQIPDAYIDEIMADLSPSEFKILMYIGRRTFGFQRYSDAISLSQICSGIMRRDGTRLDYGTDLGKTAVVAGLARLTSIGLIGERRHSDARAGHRPNVYTVLCAGSPLLDPGPLDDTELSRPSRLVKSPPPENEQGGPEPVHSPLQKTNKGVQKGPLPVVQKTNKGVQHLDTQKTVRGNREKQKRGQGARSSRIMSKDGTQHDQASRTGLAENLAPLGQALALSTSQVRQISEQITVLASVHSMDEERLLPLVWLAVQRTVARRDSIRVRQAEDPTQSDVVPYFLATLQALADEPPVGAPSRHRTSLAALQGDTGQPEAALQYGDNAVWQAVLDEQKETLTLANYQRWFAHTRVISHEGTSLVVGVADASHLYWLDIKLRPRIEAALRAHGDMDLSLSFVVADGEPEIHRSGTAEGYRGSGDAPHTTSS